MRIAIAGTGSIGQRHINNVLSVGTETKLFFLRRSRGYDQLAHKYDATILISLEDLLIQKVDALIIATPSALHYEAVSFCLKNSIPCYIEKPLLTSRRELIKLEKDIASIDSVPTTMMGCNLRYLDSIQKIRSVLLSQALGELSIVSLNAGQWLPDWRPQQNYRESYSAKRNLGGGVIFDLIHEIDIAQWLLGEFDAIHAITATNPDLDINTEAAAGILMKNKDGVITSINLDYIARKPIRNYRFVGSKGSLEWDLFKGETKIVTKDSITVIDEDPNSYDIGETYKKSMTKFLTAVHDSKTTDQDIFEGIKSMKLALNIRDEAGL